MDLIIIICSLLALSICWRRDHSSWVSCQGMQLELMKIWNFFLKMLAFIEETAHLSKGRSRASAVVQLHPAFRPHCGSNSQGLFKSLNQVMMAAGRSLLPAWSLQMFLPAQDSEPTCCHHCYYSPQLPLDLHAAIWSSPYPWGRWWQQQQRMRKGGKGMGVEERRGPTGHGGEGKGAGVEMTWFRDFQKSLVAALTAWSAHPGGGRGSWELGMGEATSATPVTVPAPNFTKSWIHPHI